jgi:hypothetical protein
VLGSCNIVQQNLSVAKGSTVINQVDCVPPVSKGKRVFQSDKAS